MREPKTEEQIAELNTLMTALLVKQIPRRLRLHRIDKRAEDVWAIPADDLSAHQYASTSSYNESFTMRLLNRPKDFAYRDWGEEVICRTNRQEVPYALEFENLRRMQVEENEWYGGY